MTVLELVDSVSLEDFKIVFNTWKSWEGIQRRVWLLKGFRPLQEHLELVGAGAGAGRGGGAGGEQGGHILRFWFGIPAIVGVRFS